jgi:hypothetical protein
VTKDLARTAREGASYVVYRQQTIGGRVAVAVDGERIRCLDAGSSQARRLLSSCPESVAGVYDATVKREQIVEDLLIVLSA